MSNLEYWIWFSFLRLLRPSLRRALLERFDGAKGVYFTEEAELKSVESIRADELEALLDRNLTAAYTVVNRCGELGVNIVTYQDAAYPERLRNIPDPPSVLYVKGRLPAVDAEPVITMVGTRKCSEYGKKMTRKIAYEIAKQGGIVCSGLTAGNDSHAAESALLAGGTVIGVLGTAINEVYPKWNGRLFDDVAATGALVSEYPPDLPGKPVYFSTRNRIMAGLCVAVVVTEAPKGSGTMLTAHHALDFGRDVFVVPGNSDADGSWEGNNLLRERSASIAENGWDVLREYESRFPGRISRNRKGKNGIPKERSIPQQTAKTEEAALAAEHPGKKGTFFKFREKNRRRSDEQDKAPEVENAPESPTLEFQLSQLSATQLRIVGVMTKPSMHVDDIVDLSRLPAAGVLSELTMLQIKGYVTQEPGKRFTLNLR